MDNADKDSFLFILTTTQTEGINLFHKHEHFVVRATGSNKVQIKQKPQCDPFKILKGWQKLQVWLEQYPL